MRSRLWLLIGLVAGTKKISQLGARGLRPGLPARAIGAGPGLEVTAEIGALLIGDLLRILLAAPACQTLIIGNAQAANMQIGMTLRTLGQTTKRQRLIGQRGTALPANKDVRHHVSRRKKQQIIWVHKNFFRMTYGTCARNPALQGALLPGRQPERDKQRHQCYAL